LPQDVGISRNWDWQFCPAVQRTKPEAQHQLSSRCSTFVWSSALHILKVLRNTCSVTQYTAVVSDRILMALRQELVQHAYSK